MFFTSVPTVNKHLPVFLLGTELCIPLKIFAGLAKHLPVFLLGFGFVFNVCIPWSEQRDATTGKTRAGSEEPITLS